MSNNLDIIVSDFENICRTCLSTEDLKPLYEKCLLSTCLVDMLMACTFVKFIEDDGLPGKICTNCIHEINQSFSFAKRCKTTDAVLRKCLKIENELTNNSSQRVGPIIKAEEEMKIEIKPEVILPNKHQTVIEVFEDCEYVNDVKQEANMEIEYVAVKQEEAVHIEYEYDKNYDDLPDDSYKDENLDETYSEKSDNLGSRPRRESTISQINEENAENICKIKSKLSNYEFKKLPDFKDLEKHQEEINHSPNASANYVCTTLSTLTHATTVKNLMRSEKQNVCSVCSKSFASPICLKVHMRIHTGEKPYSCGICSKDFTQNTTLNNHMRIHTGEKPYRCEICSKAFNRSSCLKYHMRIHTGEKPYSCRICRKDFAHHQGLRYHALIHTGEKPFSCDVCNEDFTEFNNLKEHMRIHTSNQQNVCSVCSKVFAHQISLKVHMRIHTGEKPFSCELCSKVFTQHTTLKNHMSIHTGEKPYSCDVCNKAFNRPSCVLRHMKIHTQLNFAARVSR